MIKHLKISHFKSIREMELDCKRVNVFIGEPNKGKTNILEGIAMLSESLPGAFQQIFRCSIVSDLYYNFDISKSIQVEIDSLIGNLSYDANGSRFDFKQTNNQQKFDKKFTLDIKGNSIFHNYMESLPIRFYKYDSKLLKFEGSNLGFLTPPSGENLPLLVYSNKALRKVISDFLKENGYRLNINPVEREIMLTKEENDELYNFKYPLISETIKRIIFLMLAIESNNNSTLLLDEPEAHTFPFYTHYIAERIALDTSNQYFLTTHNSYLLHSIVEKTPIDELNVGIVYMENYETKVKILTPDQLSELSETDIFYNLELFLEEA